MEIFISSPTALAKKVWFMGIIDNLLKSGLNKTKVAEKLNISAQRLTNLINGTDAISDKVIDSIVETLSLGSVSITTTGSLNLEVSQGENEMHPEMIIDRLDQYMLLSGITDGQVSANARLDGDFLKKKRESGKDLTEKEARKIAEALTNINEEWLIHGTGNMRNDKALPILNKKEPMARILDALEAEGVNLEEFATAVNSNKFLFNNAIKWPYDSRNLILGNDKQIRGWIDAFCDVFPKYSKFWILTGKGSKYNYPVIGD